MRGSDRVLVFACILVVLPLLCAASGTFKSWNPIDSASFSRRIQDNGHKRARVSSVRRSLAGNATTWNTIDGNPPLVIANGGSSGLFPDQTQTAYLFAVNNSLQSDTALFCDLQLTKDGYSVCRTGIDLSSSTNVNDTFQQLQNTYDVNGEKITGFFAVDFNASQVFQNLSATQSNAARSPFYDGMYPLVDPTAVLNYTNIDTLLWLNVEYPGFFSQFNNNMSDYVLSLLGVLPYNFVSSPEVSFLKAVSKGNPKAYLVLRFHGKTEIEPSTNVTYGSLLSDLKTIATYATGIMVPKDYVWPVDTTTNYLGTETTLVKDAHAAGLAIYVSGFLTDQLTPIYNYSFDPIREYLQYVPSAGSNVDGFLTDFPSTASEALACYKTQSSTKTGSGPLIISHNGASGDYPGCTMLAYEAAVKDGANIIDCSIQITQDGVPICRESPNLLDSTDVSTSSTFFPARVSTIPELGGKGLYSFNMTWEEIKNNLKARIYTPGTTGLSGTLVRNPANDGKQPILAFSEFLAYAKNQSTGILVDIQNAYFLETQLGLNVLGPVISNLTGAGLLNSSKVTIQSEDSAVLYYLRDSTNFTLAYRITSTNVTISAKEVKEIKSFADHVTLPRGLIQRANFGYLVNSSGVVELFHGQNMSVYVNFLRNAFTALAFDYEADPTLELNTMVNFFKVDGLITDFPATASAFLSKQCGKYPMRFVIPGDLLTTIPLGFPPLANGNPLNVNESALPTVFGAKAGSSAPASSPSASPSGSFHTPVPYFLIVLTVLGSVFQSFIQ